MRGNNFDNEQDLGNWLLLKASDGNIEAAEMFVRYRNHMRERNDERTL